MRHFHVLLDTDGVLLYNWQYEDAQQAAHAFVRLSQELIDHSFDDDYFDYHEEEIAGDCLAGEDMGLGIGTDELRFLLMDCDDECIPVWLN